MNNCHMRTYVTEGASAMQPIGTTSNEASHAELRAAFRQVYHINVASMRLRLNCFVLSKQVAFEAALRVNSFRQRWEGEVLSRVLARQLLDEDAWVQWCKIDDGCTFVRKASLPLRCSRMRDAARIRLWKAGLSTVNKKTKSVKRTVFTRKRQTHLFGASGHWR